MLILLVLTAQLFALLDQVPGTGVLGHEDVQLGLELLAHALPPVLGGADVLSFLPVVQACLLVLEAGKTTRDELRAATKALTQASMIGTVLNRGIVEQGAYY